MAQAKESLSIHEATLAPGPSGLVEAHAELTEAQAVDRRKLALDIVVCGPDGKQNRRMAGNIEAAVGKPILLDAPHARAGKRALPHYHQASHAPDGHSFYEVGRRRARKPKP